ncbi:MAG: hypothetical protein U1E46_11220 [Hyphomicrobiales bacterium]
MNESTLKQIEALDLDPARPLVICDVDEVTVHFLKGFESFLEERDLWLDARSFALNGNIKKRMTHEAVPQADVGGLLMGFFAERTRHLEAIEGAADTLESLSGPADVVMLTNIPEAFREDRIANLKGHGMPYPVIANSGPKGPAVTQIARAHEGPVVFIDDIPHYLSSVRDHRPHTHLVHFMQNERFARHVGPLDYVHVTAATWADLHPRLADILGIGE